MQVDASAYLRKMDRFTLALSLLVVFTRTARGAVESTSNSYALRLDFT